MAHKDSALMSIYVSPKSATVPVYSAECSPAAIRGALVMMVSPIADGSSAVVLTTYSLSVANVDCLRHHAW